MNTNEIFGHVIVVILLNVLVFPMVLIWSINTLLGMHIDFSLLNWFAAWMIISCMRGAEFSINK